MARCVLYYTGKSCDDPCAVAGPLQCRPEGIHHEHPQHRPHHVRAAPSLLPGSGPPGRRGGRPRLPAHRPLHLPVRPFRRMVSSPASGSASSCNELHRSPAPHLSPVDLHTRGCFLTLEHLRDLEQRLLADRYCRIHRSHTVTLKATQRVERDHGSPAHTCRSAPRMQFRAVLGCDQAARMKSSPSTKPLPAKYAAIRSPVPRWLMNDTMNASPAGGSRSCGMKA